MAIDTDTDTPPPVANLETKARLLMLLMVLLVAGAVAYLMYARGAFERTQELVLVADDSEGIVVGMDMTFSGFPSVVSAASSCRRRATHGSSSTSRGVTRAGCGHPASSRWKTAWSAAPRSAPSPVS